MDAQLKSTLMGIYADRMTNAAEKNAFGTAIESMWRGCLERGSFGYSAHYDATVWTLPDLFRLLHPRVETAAQFERMCRAMPEIIHWLPYDSEEGPWGYTHTIDLGSFNQRLADIPDFDGFIRGFEQNPVSVCSDCGKDMQVEKRDNGYILTCTCGSMMVC